MKKRIITVLFIALLIISASGCTQQNKENIDNESVESENLDMTEEERKAVEQLLKDNNIDPSILDESTNTEMGGTILGDAKPVKQFRTLHDGEEYYESYFGFHNTIDSLQGYSLVGLYCINDEFMQGIYEADDGSKNLVVKFSKTLTTDELSSPYEDREYIDHIELENSISAHIEGNSSDELNLMLLGFKNNKSYSIYSASGLPRETMVNIGNELVTNLMSMDDWE